MSTEPEQIREDIERTRAELSSDVDALTDKVSPSQVAQRQADKVRSAVGGVRDRVMGSASDAKDAAGEAASGVASSVGGAASNLPHAATEKTRGNPLAAGLIAFGAGWLVSSLLPSSRPEQRLAQSAKEQAAPVVQQAKDAAQDLAGSLKEPAQDAVAAVKDRATEAGATLKDDGREAAADLRSQATDATDAVRGAHADGPPRTDTGGY